MGDEKEFTEMIKAIKVRHINVVPTMALGVQQLKNVMRVLMRLMSFLIAFTCLELESACLLISSKNTLPTFCDTS